MKSLVQLFIVFSFVLVGCSDDDTSVAQIVDEGREVAAYVRTVEIQNSEFNTDLSENVFQAMLEVQDEEDGGLLEAIDVYVTFKDNTSSNGDNSTSETFLKALPQADFYEGPFGLPRNLLTVSQAEVMDLLSLSASDFTCKDQVLLRIELKLTDGRSFTTGQASSKIIAFDDFWSSPFCYTINVVETLDSSLFLGTYNMEALSNTILPPSFGQETTVEITQGHSPNNRILRLRHRMSIQQEQPRIFRFTVACDKTIFGKNALASKIAFCGVDPAILMGPDTKNGSANPNDDTVFQLWFVEGYLGWDGNCDFGTVPVKYKLTKQ